MKSINIEILNPKAMQLIEGMQNLKLIKIKRDNEVSDLQSFLMKSRRNADTAPDLGEITDIVKEVRAKRYEGK